MQKSFVTRYRERAAETNSVLCVGLDPRLDHVPPPMRTSNAGGVRGYLQHVIGFAADLAPVVKFQYACYAGLTKDMVGLYILRDLVEYARFKGLLTILDFKRTDIGDTMKEYGAEGFNAYGADACTLGGPYLGPTFWPVWKPWLEDGRMAINMIRTSNKNTPEDDMQMWTLPDGDRVYERVAKRTADWHARVSGETGGRGAVGGVVGATHPDQAARSRELVGDEVFLLIPGYGDQGGGADGAMIALPNSRRELMGTVNSSRGITYTSWYDKEAEEPRKGDPLKLVEGAIKAANADLNGALERWLQAS